MFCMLVCLRRPVTSSYNVLASQKNTRGWSNKNCLFTYVRHMYQLGCIADISFPFGVGAAC